MNSEDSIINMGIEFSHQDNAGTGFLLSMDEVELVRNMARSLKTQEDIKFLNTIADKEYITNEEKEEMHQIFKKAASRIKKEVSLTI